MSGAEARRTPCPKGGGQEELPHVRGQGSGGECQTATAQERPRGATRRRRSGGGGGQPAKRSYPASEVRGGGREEIPSVRGQWQWLGGDTPRPSARGPGRWPGGLTPRRGCAGAGGPRGAIPRWRSGRAAVRRYPSSKVRSIGCALLEQPWRDTPCPR